MKIQVTQELIDSLKHNVDDNSSHFPCIIEKAIGGGLWMNSDGRAGNGKGHIDEAGLAYLNAYDAHDWDAIQPGEFEYTPDE